jgi:signal transduction histidine kinase
MFILFQLSQLLMFRYHFSFPELLTHSTSIITILLIIFIYHYAGQEITNHYNYMFTSVLETLFSVIILKYLLHYIWHVFSEI